LRHSSCTSEARAIDAQEDRMSQHKSNTESAPQQPGEGNREADRKYRNAATEHAQSGRSERAARDAEEALEDEDEAAELEEAEEEGKSRARSTHDQRGEE
jgi:hypothetical protein